MPRAWLTQSSIPTKRVYAITLPDSEEWRAQFLGALLLLTGAENWELFGTLTPEQMAAEWLDIFLEFTRGETTMIPVGTVLEYGGSALPDGFLWWDGSIISRTTYAELFAVIGTNFGAGDGVTTFQLGNRGGRVAIGKNLETEFNTLGQTGGAKTHTLTVAELATHTHIQNSHLHVHNSHNHGQAPHNHGQLPHNHTIFGHSIGLGGTDRRIVQAASGGNNTLTEATEAANILQTATNQASTSTENPQTATNQNTGSGAAHNNLPPYLVENFIVRYRP